MITNELNNLIQNFSNSTNEKERNKIKTNILYYCRQHSLDVPNFENLEKVKEEVNKAALISKKQSLKRIYSNTTDLELLEELEQEIQKLPFKRSDSAIYVKLNKQTKTLKDYKYWRKLFNGDQLLDINALTHDFKLTAAAYDNQIIYLENENEPTTNILYLQNKTWIDSIDRLDGPVFDKDALIFQREANNA